MSNLAVRTLLTEEVAAKILSNILQGYPPRVACQAAGINRQTLNKWLTRGKDYTDEPYRTFYLSYQNASAQAERVLLDRIDQATDWKAHKYRLAILDPDTYGEQTTLNIKVQEQLMDILPSIEGIVGPELYEQILQKLAASGSEIESPALESHDSVLEEVTDTGSSSDTTGEA